MSKKSLTLDPMTVAFGEATSHRRVVKLRGKKLILMGTLKRGGPLVEKMPTGWKISFAHLFEDGTIRQFGRIIGHRSDLKLVARSVQGGG